MGIGNGEINIGKLLPGILSGFGMKITGIRPMAKIATPDNLNWQWPKTFYHSYFPRLVEAGYLSEENKKKAFTDLIELENTTGSSIFCPVMTEVIAIK